MTEQDKVVFVVDDAASKARKRRTAWEAKKNNQKDPS